MFSENFRHVEFRLLRNDDLIVAVIAATSC